MIPTLSIVKATIFHFALFDSCCAIFVNSGLTTFAYLPLIYMSVC